MNKETLDKIAHKIIEISFYSLFFATPPLMNPANSELFELPKMFFIWALSVFIAGVWIIRMIVNQRILFHRTFLDIPLVLFLVSQFLSFLFSIDHHTSFWGYYTRFNGGLASTIAYALLYWSFVSNMDFKKSLFTIHLSLITGLFVALWGIPAHFGYDPTCFIFGYGLNTSCWTVQFVPTIRIFSTLGQPNWLAAWLTALVPLSMALALNSKLKTPWPRQAPASTQRGEKRGGQKSKLFFYAVLIAILLLAIVYTNSKSGLAGLIVGFGVFFTALLIKQNIRRPWYILSTIILGILLMGTVFFFPKTQALTQSINNCLSIIFSENQQLKTDITPSSDIRCIVWKGALSIWRQYPILGTGPETFAYSYYQFRPVEHNLTSEWDYLYNKAHNEYLNLLANTGTVGLGAYLLLIIWVIRQFTIKREENYTLYILNSALFAGYASILVTNFFGFSIVPAQLQFFLYPAMAVVLTGSMNNELGSMESKVLGIKQKIFILLFIILTSYFIILIFRYYLADIHYAKGERLANENQFLAALPEVRKSTELRPGEPLYQNELANILSSLVLALPQEQATTAAQLARQGVAASDRAIEISPQNLNFLRTRSTVFVRLVALDSAYFSQAAQTLEKATLLAPTEPKIAYNLGFLYWQSGNLDGAISHLTRATTLRPIYRDAWFALGEAYWENDEQEKARESLNYILKNIESDDKEVMDKLKEWRDKR